MKKIYIITLLLLFVGLEQGRAQIINTVAGTGVAGYTGDNGPATNAKIGIVLGIVTDATGNIYFTDAYNSCVRKINPAGVINTIAGSTLSTCGFSGDGGPALAAELCAPRGIAIDAAGNIYIADRGNYRIRKINTAGIISTIAGNGTFGNSGDGGPATAAQFFDLFALHCDNAGNIYVSDFYYSVVRKITPAGIITKLAGTGIGGFSGDGGPANLAALFQPSGITTDMAGNLYISDKQNNRIRKINPAGIISTIAGTGNGGFSGDGGSALLADIGLPIGLARDASGNLFFSEAQSAHIRKISVGDTITTIAGNGVFGYGGDSGPAIAAMISACYGIAVNNQNMIYIGDSLNNRVRMICHDACPVTGIKKQLADASISLYPNPASDKIIFKLAAPARVLIYNAFGQLVYDKTHEDNENEISITPFPQGIYTLKTCSKNKINYMAKFTKTD